MRIPMDENSLSKLIRMQDHEAFDYLYENYSAAVFGEIIRMIKKKEVAEDILQDVFITIWRKGCQYDPVKGRLFTWILSITRNKCTDHLRKSVNINESLPLEKVIMDMEQSTTNKSIEFSMLYKHFKTMNTNKIEMTRLIYAYGNAHHEPSDMTKV